MWLDRVSKELIFNLERKLLEILDAMFVYRSTRIPFSHTNYFRVRISLQLFEYDLHWLRKIKSSDWRSPPASRVLFLFFYTFRAMDVFTDAGIRSHGLHFINLGDTSSPVVDPLGISGPLPRARMRDSIQDSRRAACFAYVTSSILLGNSRHAGTS